MSKKLSLPTEHIQPQATEARRPEKKSYEKPTLVAHRLDEVVRGGGGTSGDQLGIPNSGPMTF
jgi:hypothetical protein